MASFVEFVKNAEKLGKKKGRLPILSAAKFFPFKEERELISLVRNEFERAMNANIELAFNGENFADSLEEMNNNESTLPSTFVEKSRAIANSVDNNARSSFSKQSEMIIGHPYFPPENARQIVETWHSNFLELCKSAESEIKSEISRIVASGKMQGWNKKKVENAVKERLPAKTKHRAELIARTELGKLNSSVNMETMKSVGIRYYKWLSTLDTRCRASHAAMNNVICSLDDPTIYFEDNPENGAKPIRHNRTVDMVKLHPGFDFQCRCSMVMWEPEIDSKYEVKEEPIAEQQQIPQEKSVVELEKVEKRAAKAEKELEVAKKAKSEVERKVEILRQANKRHSERTNENRERILNTKIWHDVIKKIKKEKIEYNEVQKMAKKMTEEEIINRIAGGDETDGSCASLAFAYIASKAGCDILDFRGGASLDFFATRKNRVTLFNRYLKSFSNKNGFVAAKLALNSIDDDKEYYFFTGKHAAIVRKTNGVLEYLELQDSIITGNGFKKLNPTKAFLKSRFGCQGQWSIYGTKLDQFAYLAEIDDILNNDKFVELMGYINTEEQKQKKGVNGSIK